MIEQWRCVLNSQIFARRGAASRLIKVGGMARKSMPIDSAEVLGGFAIAIENPAALMISPFSIRLSHQDIAIRLIGLSRNILLDIAIVT